MANDCWTEIKVLGTHENINKFYNALVHKGDLHIGRCLINSGGFPDNKEIVKDNIYAATIYGDCRGSFSSTLDIALEPSLVEKGIKNIDITEASEMLDVEIEAYCSEPGAGFEQHYIHTKPDNE